MPAERTGAMCREYNGWKNYPTWALNVHGFLDNRDDLEELAAKAYLESDGEHRHRWADACYAVHNRLVEMLEELEDDAREQGLSPVLMDVLGYALHTVDVEMLAQYVVDDAPDVPHEAPPATAGTK